MKCSAWARLIFCLIVLTSMTSMPWHFATAGADWADVAGLGDIAELGDVAGLDDIARLGDVAGFANAPVCCIADWAGAAPAALLARFALV